MLTSSSRDIAGLFTVGYCALSDGWRLMSIAEFSIINQGLGSRSESFTIPIYACHHHQGQLVPLIWLLFAHEKQDVIDSDTREIVKEYGIILSDKCISSSISEQVSVQISNHR